jgi:hypothetical protein
VAPRGALRTGTLSGLRGPMDDAARGTPRRRMSQAGAAWTLAAESRAAALDDNDVKACCPISALRLPASSRPGNRSSSQRPSENERRESLPTGTLPSALDGPPRLPLLPARHDRSAPRADTGTRVAAVAVGGRRRADRPRAQLRPRSADHATATRPTGRSPSSQRAAVEVDCLLLACRSHSLYRGWRMGQHDSAVTQSSLVDIRFDYRQRLGCRLSNGLGMSAWANDFKPGRSA